MTEAIEAMSRIWADDEAEYHGEHVNFDPIWCWPKPLQTPRPPLLIAGNSVGAMKRAVAFGDGWLPTHRGKHDLPVMMLDLRRRAEAIGRPRPSVTYIASEPSASEIERCLDAGIDRVLLPLPTGDLEDLLVVIESCADVRERVGT
jgi:alkanesulfonate monooxygenase SsuD/methylene tetrahydromethanopterin reductase-like flavin-dependent oxidoreductase (luciferase family)